MLSLLDADRWFSENSASMVFDWTASSILSPNQLLLFCKWRRRISYNGNMDLFTHNVVCALQLPGIRSSIGAQKLFG